MFGKFLRVIKAFAGISRPQTWPVFITTFEVTKFDHSFKASWSQSGEDIGLESSLRDIKFGSYIDVGAHHPSRFSVTRKLSSLGWSGINIDANPALLKAFDKQRPKDVNLWACVGTESEYTLTIFDEPAMSTVNQEWKARFLKTPAQVTQEIRVPGISLRAIFDKYFDGGFPDLLCIDAEGADLNVLQSAFLTPGTGPKWLLLEADPPLSNVLETPAVKYALELGYQIHLVMGMSTFLQMKLL